MLADGIIALSDWIKSPPDGNTSYSDGKNTTLDGINHIRGTP